ncbi:ubiquitin-like protein Pup [Auritidibacter ignavus]|uniref:Prokaryotic ubiquitin-like protein Pup n=1 Tax=Auritidibacter ignavus TaxID=678932 RepID=A0AAJ6AP99_9MICC|nr:MULTISPECIES: ubiquitin-like protein Pup [Auritidibacter]PXA77809.1 ubiquitin-like protein Pup [Auritidibacter sp. NML100628]WGH93716.1 ubiquitin-like protein Pup [Auritidibacter ignavus]
MAAQQNSPQYRNQREDQHDPGTPEPATAPATSSSSSAGDLDSLLDDIDDVLETNAEEFVKGFVQKGGQ